MVKFMSSLGISPVLAIFGVGVYLLLTGCSTPQTNEVSNIIDKDDNCGQYTDQSMKRDCLEQSARTGRYNQNIRLEVERRCKKRK